MFKREKPAPSVWDERSVDMLKKIQLMLVEQHDRTKRTAERVARIETRMCRFFQETGHEDVMRRNK